MGRKKKKKKRTIEKLNGMLLIEEDFGKYAIISEKEWYITKNPSVDLN